MKDFHSLKHLFRFGVVVALLLTGLLAHAQVYSSLRYRTIIPAVTQWQLDSLVIAPGSFYLIRTSGDTLPDTAYTLRGWNGSLTLHPQPGWSNDTLLLAVYRVFPFSLKPVYRDEGLKPEQELRDQAGQSYLYTPLDQRNREDDNFFNFGELEKSGSISRAISIGSNQDAVLNSAMNLQLSGELAPGITIAAAITDNTIPIQPEGNSQQLREFDKVYIRAKATHWEVVAGDFDVQHGNGEFLRFNKRAQGALFIGNWQTGEDAKGWKMSSRVSGAIAKGKYGNSRFNGIEGNQGPYQLHGANNETFIVVLAGSEQVYLDGKLLMRGAGNDYVIDYNTAQVTFTSKMPVTKDKRFVILFEYAERYYNRSLVYLQQQASTEKISLNFQYYREQDIRSQPINQQQLLDDNRQLLSDIGDEVGKAVVPNVKEVPFSNSEVLYKRTDTLVESIYYDSVYVYSTDPDSARYRLGFSWVGQNKGNYIQVSNAANGKVFKWVAPESGIAQGEYEPAILLITPKTQQMASLSGSWNITGKARFFFESAVSGYDVNTFSKLQDDDNTGLALMAGLHHTFVPGDDDSSRWKVETDALYRLIQARFSSIERFRDIEYERDWNLNNTTPVDEHYGKMQVKVSNRQVFNALYALEPLVRNRDDFALRHTSALQAAAGKWKIDGKGSYLVSENSYMPNKFLRHSVSVGRRSGAWLFNLLEEGENNRLNLPGNDTLVSSSFAFQRWQALLERGDSARIITRLRMGQRYDQVPLHTSLTQGFRADEILGSIGSSRIPGHQFEVSLGYRKLHSKGPAIGTGPEESLLGRAEYNHKLWKGLIRGSLFYEFGSGLEYKKEFTYLEVPAGQGVYTWKDYNGDSIKQLDEFEVAVFQDEASYLRIFTPTTQYERVYTMQYSQSVQIEPAAVVEREKAIGKFLARFSDQGNYRVEQKVGGENIFGALDPWLIDLANPLLISLSTSLRNTLFFNRTGSRYGIDYTTSVNNSKVLLVNGFEERGQRQHILRLRFNLPLDVLLRLEGSLGTRLRASEFFVNNDYNLNLQSASAEVQYQPGTQYRISLKYLFSNKINTSGSNGEQSLLHRAGAEFRYSLPLRGTLQVQTEYIGIQYNSSEQSSIAFEMLEGLSNGSNFTWTLGYQRILANHMQIGIQYNGRKASSNPIVHVGSVQVRAFF